MRTSHETPGLAPGGKRCACSSEARNSAAAVEGSAGRNGLPDHCAWACDSYLVTIKIERLPQPFVAAQPSPDATCSRRLKTRRS